MLKPSNLLMRLAVLLLAVVTAPPFISTALADDGAQFQPPSGVEVEFIGRGWQFRTSEGMTLYWFELGGSPFGSSSSECDDGCPEEWEPLRPQAGDEENPFWKIVTREDGSKQWSFNDRPLYLHKDDPFPGAAFGATSRNDWDVVIMPIELPPAFTIRETQWGHVLVTDDVSAIFADDGPVSEGQNDIADHCDTACRANWEPLYAPALANGVGLFSIKDWSDGSRQWMYEGKPLYRHIGDRTLGASLGAQSENRSIVVLSPPPAMPDWVIEQSTDAGKLLALDNGRVLYMYRVPRRYIGGTKCDEACFEQFWSPVLAEQYEGAVGDWTIVDHRGNKQWAYKGRPLYINQLDEWPGDISGTKSWSYRVFKTINRTGNPIAKLH